MSQISTPTTAPKIGVLLLNLGTPDATDYWSVRRYLKEFLSDRRVIEVPRWQWWLILNIIILSVRPQRSGALYEKIWDKDANDSPLRVISASQARKLSKRFEGKDILVDFAMRYGNPSIEAKLNALKEQGCNKILLLPLYPQYSSPTIASVNDKAFDAFKAMRWQPTIRIAPPYFDKPAYIEALAKSVTDAFQKLDFIPEQLLISFHGMPKSYIDAGDPYSEHCHETVRLLSEQLGWPEEKIGMAFQSRFGRTEWMKPYLDNTLMALPKKGVKNLVIIAPAFSVDCLETLEELAIEGKETFINAGGENFAYIPCLNDTNLGMDVIETIVNQELQGWA